jgi:AcrR family transcriptional regulator
MGGVSTSDDPPRALRRDARANREALLVAAAETFRRDPEASIDAVAACAGLSRRAVYGHFPSREALLAALIDRGAAHITEALAGVHDDDPAVHVGRIGVALWTQISHVKLFARMIVRSPLDREAARGLEPVRLSLRDAVSRGIAGGVFRDDVEPALVARLIEAVAIDVLNEAVERDLDDARARRLVIVAALGVAGLSWRQADDVAVIAETGQDRHDDGRDKGGRE